MHCCWKPAVAVEACPPAHAAPGHGVGCRQCHYRSRLLGGAPAPAPAPRHSHFHRRTCTLLACCRGSHRQGPPAVHRARARLRPAATRNPNRALPPGTPFGWARWCCGCLGCLGCLQTAGTAAVPPPQAQGNVPQPLLAAPIAPYWEAGTRCCHSPTPRSLGPRAHASVTHPPSHLPANLMFLPSPLPLRLPVVPLGPVPVRPFRRPGPWGSPCPTRL